MPTAHLSFKQTGYFSRLICDYIDQKEGFSEFYERFPSLENFKDQIEEKAKGYNDVQRSVLVSVLQRQYKGIDLSESTALNIDYLSESNTFTITTGHQLNLFTGPLYFLYKIVSVINLCEQLKSQYQDKNFVPVFWMASEDHDFEEISFFNFMGQKVQWNKMATGAVGRLNTEGLDKVFEVFASKLHNGINAKQIKSLFRSAYLEHDNLANATRFLANELFKDYGLVILDADDKELKRLFVPQVRKELEDQVTEDCVLRTNAKLAEKGYKIQVNPREVNLFYLKDDLRERLVLEEGVFRVNNTDLSFTKAEILKELEVHPDRFSPNVLMRPLYQEKILPNLCYIGGGGEMAYWFQLKESFEAQKVVFPMLLQRDSVLVRSTKQFDKQLALGISDADLFLKKNDFINKYVRRIANIDVDFSPQLETLKSQFAHLYQIAEQTDASFLGAVKAQEVKQIKGLKHLEKRLLKAQKRVLADKIARSTDLKEGLFPNGNLQERQLNFSELFLEQGADVVKILKETLNPLDMRFLLLTI